MAGAVVAAAAVAGIAALLGPTDSAQCAATDAERAQAAALSRGANDENGVMYAIEDGDLRFEFNAVMGTEVLFRVGPAMRRIDRVDLTLALPGDVERLREKLLKKLGISSLAELRASHRDTIDRLTELGYL